MSSNDVLITGIGLVSALGEGVDAHWQKLTADTPQPVTDDVRFPPYVIHPLPVIDWGLQIPKRGDQRQMETWQRLGTYAAGLALDDAAIKTDEALCATMDMVVAAGGGERDEAVDSAILEASTTRNDRDVLLNEKLTTDLRPTLFLAQLSNLLAGNISIVHKVTGSSRTFMGEEGAGVAAVETAAARIRSGQSSHMLVGGAFQTEHHDMLLGYELAGYLHRGPWKSVWQRAGLRRRRRSHRLGRGVPRARIARACAKARPQGLCAAWSGLLRPSTAPQGRSCDGNCSTSLTRPVCPAKHRCSPSPAFQEHMRRRRPRRRRSTRCPTSLCAAFRTSSDI